MVDFDSLLLPRAALSRRLRIHPQPSPRQGGGTRGQPRGEPRGSLRVGVAVHFLPALLFYLFVGPGGGAASAAGVGTSFLAASLAALLPLAWLEMRHPADAAMARPTAADVLRGVLFTFGIGVGLGGAVVCAAWRLCAPGGGAGRGFDWWHVAYAALLADYWYYWYHRALCHSEGGPAALRRLYEAHLPHHLVSHLDFWRGNLSSVVDTAVFGFQWVLGPVAALYGMDLPSCLAAYGMLLLLQATHHANYTPYIGALRFVFVDGHAHKLHHCQWGRLVNFGACFSMWDRNLGTFYENAAVGPNRAARERSELPVRPRRGPPQTLLAIGIAALHLLPVLLPAPRAACVTAVACCAAAAGAARLHAAHDVHVA